MLKRGLCLCLLVANNCSNVVLRSCHELHASFNRWLRTSWERVLVLVTNTSGQWGLSVSPTRKAET